MAVKAAQEDHIRRRNRLVRPDDLARMLHEQVHHARGFFSLWAERSQRQHWITVLQRIGTKDIRAQPWPAQDNGKAVFSDRLDHDFNILNLGGQEAGKWFADLVIDAPGTPVHYPAGLIDQTVITSHGDIVGSQLKTGPYSFQHTAANPVLQRIIAKKTKMTRSALHGYAWAY